MMKAENRHYDEVHKKKQHPASKCKKPNCLVCHNGKVLKMKTKQEKVAEDQLKDAVHEIGQIKKEINTS